MKRKGVFSIVQLGLWSACLSLAGLATAQPLVTNWVAFNDHQRGNNTAARATAYTVTATGTPVGGRLEDIISGTTVQVGVTIHTDGDVSGYASTVSAPNAGTPAAQIFGDANTVQIDWPGSGILVGASAPWSADYTLTFTNLNPNAKYVFYGTGVRGGGYTGRWNLATISNALSFVPAHIAGPGSPGIITNGWSPYGDVLTASQAAFDVGDNLCGDVIGWANIVPNGTSFSIICTNYRFLAGTTEGAPMPNGATNEDKYAYSFSAVMLAEMVPPVVPKITLQPADITIVQLSPGSLSAAGTGSPYVNYQWYKAPTNSPTLLAGQTSPTFTIASAALTDAGGYFVVVANSVGSVTSRVAQITVNRDTTLPALVSCIASPDYTADTNGNIYMYTVTFSKAVDMNTAANNNVGVYSFRSPDGTKSYAALTAVSTSPSNVVLTSVEPFVAQGFGYGNFRLVCVAGGAAGVEQISDIYGNLLPANSFVPIFWNIPLIPAPLYDTNMWDYYENKSATSSPLYGQTWQTNGDFGVTWKQGQQMFSGSLTATRERGDTPEFGGNTNALRTKLTAPSTAAPNGPVLITYYRRQFFMPLADSNAVTLKMRHVIDDGAAMYLNTTTVPSTFNRIRMPSTAFTWSTPGLMAPRNTSGVHPTETTNNPMVLSTTNLRLGANNFFAIENHQTSSSATNTGVVTGVELIAYITNFSSTVVTVHPKLNAQLLGTGQVRISWSPNDGTLMQSSNPANTNGWTRVTGASNPWTTTPAGHLFYKLSK